MSFAKMPSMRKAGFALLIAAVGITASSIPFDPLATRAYDFNDGLLEYRDFDSPSLEYRDVEVPTLEYRQVDYPLLEYREIVLPSLEYREVELPSLEHREAELPSLGYREIEPQSLGYRDIEAPSLEYRDVDPAWSLEHRDIELPSLELRDDWDLHTRSAEPWDDDMDSVLGNCSLLPLHTLTDSSKQTLSLSEKQKSTSAPSRSTRERLT